MEKHVKIDKIILKYEIFTRISQCCDKEIRDEHI